MMATENYCDKLMSPAHRCPYGSQNLETELKLVDHGQRFFASDFCLLFSICRQALFLIAVCPLLDLIRLLRPLIQNYGGILLQTFLQINILMMI